MKPAKRTPRARARLAALLLAAAGALPCRADEGQGVPVETPDQSVHSRTSPYYFGPNAFPIPDILDKVSDRLRIGLAADCYTGFRGDLTGDLHLSINIPLWTRRANLSLWMPAVEWYRNSERNMEVSGIAPAMREKARKGVLAGDVYVSADLQVFEEARIRPDVTVRAALKTASGSGNDIGRYYDSPGYFFDAAVAKTFTVGNSGVALRGALSAGFLCWQTERDLQNDAVMFGALLRIDYRRFSLSGAFGGYVGWENIAYTDRRDSHDAPMSVKIKALYSFGMWEAFAQYQRGVRDYPYNQVRLGVSVGIDILKTRSADKTNQF